MTKINDESSNKPERNLKEILASAKDKGKKNNIEQEENEISGTHWRPVLFRALKNGDLISKYKYFSIWYFFTYYLLSKGYKNI